MMFLNDTMENRKGLLECIETSIPGPRNRGIHDSIRRASSIGLLVGKSINITHIDNFPEFDKIKTLEIFGSTVVRLPIQNSCNLTKRLWKFEKPVQIKQFRSMGIGKKLVCVNGLAWFHWSDIEEMILSHDMFRRIRSNIHRGTNSGNLSALKDK